MTDHRLSAHLNSFCVSRVRPSSWIVAAANTKIVSQNALKPQMHRHHCLRALRLYAGATCLCALSVPAARLLYPRLLFLSSFRSLSLCFSLYFHASVPSFFAMPSASDLSISFAPLSFSFGLLLYLYVPLLLFFLNLSFWFICLSVYFSIFYVPLLLIFLYLSLRSAPSFFLSLCFYIFICLRFYHFYNFRSVSSVFLSPLLLCPSTASLCCPRTTCSPGGAAAGSWSAEQVRARAVSAEAGIR